MIRHVLQVAITGLKIVARAIVAGFCGMGAACLSHQLGASNSATLITGAAATGIAVALLAWAIAVSAKTERSDTEEPQNPLTPTPSPTSPSDQGHAGAQESQSAKRAEDENTLPDFALKEAIPRPDPLKLKPKNTATHGGTGA